MPSSFQKSSISTPVSVANGGTGATTLGDAGVLIGNGTGAVQVTSAGTAGQVLTSNGAGVDPTFQAAAGGGATGNFIIPQGIGVWGSLGTNARNVNTTGYTWAFYLPHTFVVDKLTIYVSAVGTAGTLDIGIYSEDGQTKEIDITTASISATGSVTTAVAGVSLSAGIHYMVIVPNGTASITTQIWGQGAFSEDIETADTEPVVQGALTVTASTLPTTFNPITDIDPSVTNMKTIFRLDT